MLSGEGKREGGVGGRGGKGEGGRGRRGKGGDACLKARLLSCLNVQLGCTAYGLLLLPHPLSPSLSAPPPACMWVTRTPWAGWSTTL